MYLYFERIHFTLCNLLISYPNETFCCLAGGMEETLLDILASIRDVPAITELHYRDVITGDQCIGDYRIFKSIG